MSTNTATTIEHGPAIVTTPRTVYIASQVLELVGGMMQAHLNVDEGGALGVATSEVGTGVSETGMAAGKAGWHACPRPVGAHGELKGSKMISSTARSGSSCR